MLARLLRRHLSPAARAYLDATAPRLAARTPLDGLRFVVLDAETTGFTVGRDRILTLSLLEITQGRIDLSRSANWLIHQPSAAVNAAVAVHGILPRDTAAGTTEAAAMEELIPRLAGAVLVGHHVSFDAAMIDEAWQRHFRLGLRNAMIDTAALSMSGIDAFRKTGYRNQRPPTLEEVCVHCGLPVMGRHTAAGDTFMTAQLFLLLLARLRRRLGRPLIARDVPWQRL